MLTRHSVFQIKKLVSLLLVIPFSQAVQSATTNSVIHHEYESPRALGMGNAFTAVADDYSALFYNPAGLARREKGHINMYIAGGVTGDSLNFMKDVESSSKTTGTEAQKQQAVADVINKHIGDHYGIDLSLPNGFWVRPNWGVAVIPLNLTADFSLHQLANISATIYSDTIMAFGLAKDYPWFSNAQTSAGITFKVVNRGYLNQAIPAIDIATNKKVINAKSFSEGATLDADVGMLYTPTLPEQGFWSLLRLAKPTFGAVVHNVLDYGFTQNLHLYNKETPYEKPEKLIRRLDLGSRWEYPELWIFGGRGTMDLRDIMHPNFSLRKGLHVGFEFDWTMFSWWKGNYRVGYSQGYLSGGLSALFTFFNLDLVTYSDDVGTYNTPKENRKWEIRMNIDI